MLRSRFGLPGTGETDRELRRVMELLIWLVIVPTITLLVLAILMLLSPDSPLRLILGVLVVTLVGCLITGAVLALLLLLREARVSRLQLDFVSKVSHELRTPLTSIRMFAETLQTNRARDPAHVTLCLDTIQREAGRLEEQIERLLDWGGMQAGRKVYVTSPEDIGDVISEAVEAVRGTVESRRQEIIPRIDGPVPRLPVDRVALIGALVNLLSNASKYSDEGQPIEIGVAANPAAVRIWVTDSGVGIPRSEHRNIFKQFYRVDDRLSRSVDGSGLGLAIVRHVVRGHRGHVELRSEPGHGSTFTVVLPIPGARLRSS